MERIIRRMMLRQLGELPVIHDHRALVLCRPLRLAHLSPPWSSVRGSVPFQCGPGQQRPARVLTQCLRMATSFSSVLGHRGSLERDEAAAMGASSECGRGQSAATEDSPQTSWPDRLSAPTWLRARPLSGGNALSSRTGGSTPINGLTRLMRMRGLEPPRGCPHTDLNRARLPIPPHPRGATV